MKPGRPDAAQGAPKAPRVCIVVLNWNGWKDTIECLESLYRLDYPDYFVVVVDNGSTDGSVEQIRKWACNQLPLDTRLVPDALRHLVTPPCDKPIPVEVVEQGDRTHIPPGLQDQSELAIIESGRNLGYAGGNNLGIRYALQQQADYVWILNNDAVVDHHALSCLVTRSLADPRVGLCGGTIAQYYAPGRLQVAGGAHFDQRVARQVLIANNEDSASSPETDEVESVLSYISGACVLVSRAFIEDVGVMEESLFLYYEELDWALRGRMSGYKLGYARDALVYHKEGAASGSSTRDRIPSAFAEYYLNRNLLWIMRRFYPEYSWKAWPQILLRYGKRLLMRQWRNARAVALAALRPSLGHDPAAVAQRVGGLPCNAIQKRTGHRKPVVLYVMHVDWDSIWQRPHVLAVQLAEEFDVRVAYAFGRHRRAMSGNARRGLRVKPFFQLPFRRQSRVVAAMNRAVLRPVFATMLRSSRPAVVWLTYPELIGYLPRTHQYKLVYDCMDDVLAFSQPPAFSNRLRIDEAALVKSADLVLASSSSLGTTLRARYGMTSGPTVVRNACRSDLNSVARAVTLEQPQEWHIGYVGTIDEALDMPALEALVRAVPDVTIDLVGPVAGGFQTAAHDRIILHGVLPQSQLYDFASRCCCMIVPFVKTPRVFAADPVKLYEYVLWGRPIITVRYPEVERYASFAEFYDTTDDLIRVVERMRLCSFRRKYTEEDRTAFLAENNWDKRGEQVRGEVRKLIALPLD